MTKVTIQQATLYCGDSREIVPGLAAVDAVVTDPPYGIGEAAGKNKSRGKLATSKDYGDDEWDNAPPPGWLILLLREKSRWQVIFGGNFYSMPPSSCWLVWDKENGQTDFADAELAWTNLPKAVRLKRWMWHGMLRAGGEDRGDHPTQKPIKIMEWALTLLPEPSQTILDPFMGSGTTGVACVNLGRSFVGIERERKYFDVACQRIESAYAQQRLFA
jgi:site-specific DNA-methyltransferase (adenine-specific)/modification methylase